MRAQFLFVLIFATNFGLAQNIPGLPPTLFPSIVSPELPIATDEISLTISMERCITIQGNVLDFQPTIRDSLITVQLPGIIAIDNVFCFFPRGSARLSLGRIPPGSYTIELRLRTGFTPITELGLIVQRTPLVVGPPPFFSRASSRPATDRFGVSRFEFAAAG